MQKIGIIYYFLMVKAKFQGILTVKVGSSENIVIIIKTPFIEAVLIGFWVFLPIFSSPNEEMAHHFYSLIYLITYISLCGQNQKLPICLYLRYAQAS